MHTSPAPFTGRKMLFVMLAFFGVIIAANLTMMGFALTTHTGVVVPNSYVASQDFNKRIADAAAQKSRGWKTSVAYQASGLVVTFTDRAGAPLRGLTVSGVIGRPVTETQDIALDFQNQSAGRYAAPAMLGAGEWRLQAVGVAEDGARHRLIHDLTVQRPGG